MKTRKLYNFRAVLCNSSTSPKILRQGPYLTTLTIVLNCFMPYFMIPKTSSLLKNPPAGTYLEPAETNKYLDLCFFLSGSPALKSPSEDQMSWRIPWVFSVSLKSNLEINKILFFPHSALNSILNQFAVQQASLHNPARNCSLQTAKLWVQRLDQGLDNWGIAVYMSGTGRDWFLLSKAPTQSPIQLAA